jgi:hypothetical protein
VPQLSNRVQQVLLLSLELTVEVVHLGVNGLCGVQPAASIDNSNSRQ